MTRVDHVIAVGDATNVAAGELAFMASSFWRNAISSRHPIEAHAMRSQGMLWAMCSSTKVPETIRKVSANHLKAIGAIDEGMYEL